MTTDLTPIPDSPDALAPTEPKWTATALQLPAKLPYERFVAMCNSLRGMTKGLQWWWGDLLNYGERAYSEDKYTSAIEVTGHEYQTLMNWASVAKRVPVSRRREALTWSHHEVVAKLPEAEQAECLHTAEEEGLSAKELRAAIKGAAPPQPSAREQLEAVGTALLGAGKHTCDELVEAANALRLTQEDVPELPPAGDCRVCRHAETCGDFEPKEEN